MNEHTYSKEQLQEIAGRMEKVASETYWLFFYAGMGASCHAFLEFNGLISKYVQVCARAADEGIDFTQANVHSNTPLPVEGHDMKYLAEKLGCIFGPLIASNPEAAEVLRKGLFGEEQPADEWAKPADQPATGPLRKKLGLARGLLTQIAQTLEDPEGAGMPSLDELEAILAETADP